VKATLEGRRNLSRELKGKASLFGNPGRSAYICLVSAVLLMATLCVTACGSTGAGEARDSGLTDLEERLEAQGKWGLWTDGTLLRGANIYQRRVYPELDGAEFIGPGPFGPPCTQEDIDRLAAMGANYVQLSHPGLYTENPPYELDEAVQENLDRLLGMIADAGMYAVIAFRTGPGRSEFTFFWDEGENWFDESYLNDKVWQELEAQDAWADMWRYTAERYKDMPTVVGYELMVEPNPNDRLLDIWDPEEFYARYSGTLFDWNQLFPRITSAVREVDPATPILVGGAGYSGVEWLPYIEPNRDDRTVYIIHQYEPHVYTHQDPETPGLTYPGAFDADYDGSIEEVDEAWLESLLLKVSAFEAEYGLPVAASEFGVKRWAPGAARFLGDLMGLFEEMGINYALWEWEPAWEALNLGYDAFNFRHGADPGNHSDVTSSELLMVIEEHWRLNSSGP
jgi:hypothetical protein